MASSVTLPTFYDEEILLFQKLNALTDAVDAKFSAGVGAADLAWPLVAEGDLDMQGNDIINVGRVNNILSAETYDDLAAVIAVALPGDVVLVPPDTTLAADSGDSFAGNGMSIVGAGPSSVIKFTGTPAGGWMIRSASGTGMRFANMTLDGDSVAGGGSGQIGLDMTGVTNLTIESVNFKNFTGPALKVSGTCNGVKVSNCAFNGGDAQHILVAKSGALEIANCTSNDAGTVGVDLTSSGATDYIDAMLANVHISSFGTTGLQAVGVAVITDSSPVTLQANGVVVSGAGSADSVILGTTGGAIEHVSWSGGQVNSSGAHGMTVNARGGHINGVEVDTPATMGIDLDTSRYVHVSDNVIRGATVGVDGSGCTAMCVAHSNSFDSCTANIVDGEFLHHYSNEGMIGVPGLAGASNITQPSWTYSAGSTGINQTVTIPAYTLQTGDVLHAWVDFYLAVTGGFGTDYLALRFDGTNLATVSGGSGPGDWSIQMRLVVTSDTTALVFHSREAGGGSSVTTTVSSIAGLDFTSDQELEVFNNFDDAAPVSTATLRFFSYWFEKTEPMSP